MNDLDFLNGLKDNEDIEQERLDAATSFVAMRDRQIAPAAEIEKQAAMNPYLMKGLIGAGVGAAGGAGVGAAAGEKGRRGRAALKGALGGAVLGAGAGVGHEALKGHLPGWMGGEAPNAVTGAVQPGAVDEAMSSLGHGTPVADAAHTPTVVPKGPTSVQGQPGNMVEVPGMAAEGDALRESAHASALKAGATPPEPGVPHAAESKVVDAGYSDRLDPHREARIQAMVDDLNYEEARRRDHLFEWLRGGGKKKFASMSPVERMRAVMEKVAARPFVDSPAADGGRAKTAASLEGFKKALPAIALGMGTGALGAGYMYHRAKPQDSGRSRDEDTFQSAAEHMNRNTTKDSGFIKKLTRDVTNFSSDAATTAKEHPGKAALMAAGLMGLVGYKAAPIFGLKRR